MGDIVRDSEIVELNDPPRFAYGERVVARSTIRNDGTFGGKEIGDILAHKGEIGYVTSIGNFLQQYYIYAVEFVESGNRVGMRGKELLSLDQIPEDILAQLGPEKTAQLNALRGA